MYHPTPYRWTTSEGLTHVFYTNHLPPSTGFGWSSLCDAVRLPIEGKHFELNQDVAEAEVTCEHCRERFGGSYVDLDDDSIAGVDGCLVRFERNDGSEIVRADLVCRGPLHEALPFEPESFSGDLAERVADVCTECWETYVDHQWRSDDTGAELCVEVWKDGGRSEYFASSVEGVQAGREAELRLVSENGLEKVVHRKDVESITLTPAQHVDY